MSKTNYTERLIGFDDKGRPIVEMVPTGEVVTSTAREQPINADAPYDAKLDGAWRKF